MSNLCCNVSSLSFVTDFTARRCGLLSGHLEQLSIACLNLERLDLGGNASCLESLQGLRNIVDHCHNLQGINLDDIHDPNIQSCVGLWKVLSEIKTLDHLRIESCTIKYFMVIDASSQHSFVQLAVKFVCLKQLELMSNDDYPNLCGLKSHQACPVLSHFPSLACCFALTKTATSIVDITAKCKHLKYFKNDYWGAFFIP